jgi:hypothetical protein
MPFVDCCFIAHQLLWMQYPLDPMLRYVCILLTHQRPTSVLGSYQLGAPKAMPGCLMLIPLLRAAAVS